MNKTGKLLFAALLITGALSFEAFAAKPEGNVFEIRTVEDFLQFSRNCRTNTWSNGLTVNLMEDLDFQDAGDVGSVAFFNGTFNGNNHSILNYRSRTPLFQTIGEDGSVRDLSVSAVISSTGDNAAALAAENRGILKGVSVEGEVTGKVNTGMVAAVNEAAGRILSCDTAGTVNGDSATGGIAGRNLGTIASSVNRASVNVTVEDSSLSVDDVRDILENVFLTRSLNNAENLRIGLDTGGIAGYNLGGGSISRCTNEGTVGYPRHGYNTGGICGRSGGAVEDCVNRGKVFGRNGVGGIAGKQQPEITVDFSKDVLTSVSDELDGINSLVTDTLNTTEGLANTTYDRLAGISKTMTEVKNSTNVIYSASLDRFDEVADSVNSTADTVTGSLEDISAETDGLTESLNGLDDMTVSLESSIDNLQEAFSMTDAERSDLLSVTSQLRRDLNTTLPFVEEVRDNLLPALPEERSARISQGLSAVNRLAGDIRALRTILDRLRGVRDRIADGSLQVEAHRRDLALSSSISNLLDSVDYLDSALSGLSRFSASLGGTLSDTASGISINMQADPAVRAAGDQMYAGLDKLSGQLDGLNAVTREDNLEVIGKLNEINRRFANLTDLLKNERDRLNGILDDGGVFVDASEAANSASRIVSCKNEADIAGDSEAGGIVGRIGVEYDLDPDRDILKSSTRSLDYTFGASALVSGSDNTGTVTGQGNHAGGIAGRADLGYIRNNTNEGDVNSADGYFVGGAAGYSRATLEGNTVRCRVTGLKNAGGICGYGETLRDNTAVVLIEGADEYAGTIAGNVDETDPAEIRNNFYYSGNYGAINNIDYAGMAEMAPDPMKTFLVKFRVNGALAGTEEVKSGTPLREVPFPETEEREGFYLRWDLPLDTEITEDTVVTGSYCLPVPMLASEEKAEGTEKPLFIADGQFREGDALTFTLEDPDHWKASIPEDGLAERRVRIHKPAYRKCRITVNGAPVQTQSFGDYLTFTTGERELEIVIENTGNAFVDAVVEFFAGI